MVFAGARKFGRCLGGIFCRSGSCGGLLQALGRHDDRSNPPLFQKRLNLRIEFGKDQRIGMPDGVGILAGKRSRQDLVLSSKGGFDKRIGRFRESKFEREIVLLQPDLLVLSEMSEAK